MSFLFGKKQMLTAPAEVLEDGRPKFMEYSRIQMENARKRFQQSEQWTQEPKFQILVHVTPGAGAPFDAQMETGLSVVAMVRPGIRVQVEYDLKHPEQVRLVDDIYALRARNPQLIDKPILPNRPVALCPHCGKYYEGTPKFCPNCGKAVS
jgi:hypothetical protein